MAGFEELVAWQKARELTKLVYQLTSTGEFAREFGLRDQIQRASVSIMSNIAEGYERGGRAEFHKFLVIAKGSCAEVRSQLYVAYAVGYIDEKYFYALKQRSEELSKILAGLKKSVQEQRENE
jgi:four helix bundle protein